MDYTQQGVLNVQRRVVERLRPLLAERSIWLDPGSPIWFDGNMALPTPGDPWKLTLSSHGESATVELTPTELDDFIAARPYEVVSQKLGRTLDSLRPKK
jgi:hypothetical protein